MMKYVQNFSQLFNLQKLAIKKVEEEGIIFIDEIDKITHSKEQMNRKSPSTDGV